MHCLDDPLTFERLDPEGIRERIRALPEQCRDAWRQAESFPFPSEFSEIDSLAVLGMGGSAIAGDIVRALALRDGARAVLVHRGYDLPAFVGERTLVVACSFSGQTEETLSAFEKALATGAKKLAITTGGRLLELAKAQRLPAYVFQYEGEPRSALGCSLMPLLVCASAAGVLPDESLGVEEAIRLMEELRAEIGDSTPLERNAGKQLATRLQGKLPVIFAAEALTEAAHRWKTQLNENSKVWAFYEEVPELNHNAVEGFGLPRAVAENAHVVFLSHPKLNARNVLRYEGTRELLAAAGVSSEVVEARGQSELARVLTAVYFGDWVSFYLAMLNGVHPAPMPAIDRMKRALAEAN